MSSSREQKFSSPPCDLLQPHKNLLGTSRTTNAINAKSNADILPNAPVLGAALLFTPNHPVPSAFPITLSPLTLHSKGLEQQHGTIYPKNGVFNTAGGKFICWAQLIQKDDQKQTDPT